MKRLVSITLVALVALSATPAGAARRVRVTRTTRTGTHTRVVVHTGFPIHRTLPEVVVRTTTFRVAPRVYLAPVVFGAAVVASIPAGAVWNGSEGLEREDGWTDFTMNIDRRGTRLLLDIDRGSAQISFAEVVFENGETQVVDFDDKVHARGVYSLLDFRDGRKVDHVRIVAKASSEDADIKLHLV